MELLEKWANWKNRVLWFERVIEGYLANLNKQHEV